MDLVGRKEECVQLDALLTTVGDGRGQGLVIRGEPGVGKTALLDYLHWRAHNFRVLRITAVEFESDLTYSGLQVLLRPLNDLVDLLPAAQSAVLRLVLDPVGEGTAERLMIYAAALSLLAVAGERKPLLVLVDDAHWLDGASREALLFSVRRLVAERVGVVFAARTAPEFPSVDLPELALGGLDTATGITLATRHSDVSGSVAAQLVAQTAGNPLALIELPAAMTPEQRHGVVALDDESLTTAARVEAVFLSQARSLAADAWRSLVICALCEGEDLAVLTRAFAAAGLGFAGVDAAVAAKLINFRGGAVRFRHPLTRSSVLSAAGPDLRARAHLAAAAAFVAPEDADRRAWHRAAAAVDRDDEVANMLAATADRALRRGGVLGEARAFERSARLTQDSDLRAHRLCKAAGAWVKAGRVTYADMLLDEAMTLGPRVSIQAEAWAHRAYIAFQGGSSLAVPDVLLRLAETASAADRLTVARAVSLTINNEMVRWNCAEMRRICQAAMVLTGRDGPHPDWPKGAVRLAQAHVLCGDSEGRDRAYACVAECERRPADGSAAELAEVLTWLADYSLASRLLEREIDQARRNGDLTLLAYALPRLATVLIRKGRPARAWATAAEALELAAAGGRSTQQAHALVAMAAAEALLNDHAACREHVETARKLVPGHFLDVEAKACHALGVAALAGGRPAEAVGHLLRVKEILRNGGVREPGVILFDADLAEAYIRSGAPQEAARHLNTLATTEPHSRTVRAAILRCQGLITDDLNPDTPFKDALDLHDPTVEPIEQARTLLCYGQRLRRRKRRRDAARILREAYDRFIETHALGWAEQCRVEIAALGHQPGSRPRGHVQPLTQQERLIAAAAADGLTNQEISARLFLSPKTVDYHLGKVYRKLGIRSRTELARSIVRGGG